MTRLVVTSLLLLVFLVSGTLCEQKDSKIENDLIGTWTYEESLSPYKHIVKVTFKKNKTFVINGKGTGFVNGPGTYKISGTWKIVKGVLSRTFTKSDNPLARLENQTQIERIEFKSADEMRLSTPVDRKKGEEVYTDVYERVK